MNDEEVAGRHVGGSADTSSSAREGTSAGVRPDGPAWPSSPPTATDGVAGPPLVGPPVSLARTSSAGGWPWRIVVAAAMGFALVLTSVQWSSASNRADRLQSRLDVLERKAEQERAKERAMPDLIDIADAIEVDDSDVDYSGTATSLDVTIAYPVGTPMEWFDQLLEDLGFEDAVSSRMGHTRALDGTQQAEAPHVTVTWTYHPDDGLNAVFSVEP